MNQTNPDTLRIFIRQLKRQQLTNANREALIRLLEGLLGETPPSAKSAEKTGRVATSNTQESSSAPLESEAAGSIEGILNDLAASLEGFYDAYIYTYSAGRLALTAKRWADPESEHPGAKPRARGLTYTVARMGQTMVIPDMALHPLYAGSESRGAIAGLPLKSGRQVIGVLTVCRRPPGGFSVEEQAYLQSMAAQAAQTLSIGRLVPAQPTSAPGGTENEMQPRPIFNERLEQAVHAAADTGAPLGLVLIDLGVLNQMIGTYGRRAGDYLQQAVATAISQTLRRTDTLGNFSPDRWAVLLEQTDRQLAEMIARRVGETLARSHFGLPGQASQATRLPMGIAIFPEDGANPQELVSAAERSLEQADGAPH